MGCASGMVATESAAQAEDAVTTILFDNDAGDFTSYRVHSNGTVEVFFARNTPNDIYQSLTSELRDHSAINRLRVNRSGPTCNRF